MTPGRIALALSCVAASLAASLTIATPGATASPTVNDARARAAALRARVTDLQSEMERATEAYDAAREQLASAQQQSIAVATAVDDAEATTQQRRDDAAARVRSLYETGGTTGLYATALTTGTVTDIMDRVAMAEHVVSAANVGVAAASADVTRLRALERRSEALTRQKAALQAAALQEQQTVTDLLTTQRRELGAASALVRRLMAEQQRAAQAAAAAAAARELAAARDAASWAGTESGAGASPSSVAAAAIATARTRLGDPYVWGGSGPDVFDCSGLTQWSYAHAGISLPRTAAEQWYAGPHVALGDLQPGDLLFWAYDDSSPASIHHVAIYLGGGMMIAAPHTGDVVRVEPVYLTGYFGATRPDNR